ncbi:MAG: hypothetical protein Q7S22_04960 [Candidatus Micrarchaeota archaeon]|nr:hypothetical protein [Candidatus Micrarchaeota archaeon]
MDVFKMMNRINQFGKIFVTLVMLLSFASMIFAGAASTTGGSNIKTALTSLCRDAQSLLGVAAILMIILGAVTYAAGQMLGAETRARASVWATNMFIGAVIGILIYIVVPVVIGMLSGRPLGTGDPCGYYVR